jgi:hypothetical protein
MPSRIKIYILHMIHKHLKYSRNNLYKSLKHSLYSSLKACNTTSLEAHHSQFRHLFIAYHALSLLITPSGHAHVLRIVIQPRFKYSTHNSDLYCSHTMLWHCSLLHQVVHMCLVGL